MARTALSKSRMGDLGCLRYFKALHLDKVKVPKNQPALMGGFVHSMIETFLVGMVAQPAREATAQSRIGWMRDVVTGGWSRRGESDFATLELQFYEEIEETLLDFAGKTTLGPHYFGAETRIAVDENWRPTDWYDTKKVFFRGIMDRLDVTESGIVTITDYKNSWRADSQEEVERGPEARSYAAIIRAVLPEAMVIRVRIHFVRVGVVREVELSPDVIETSRERIVAESNRLEAAKERKAWPATPGALCEFCPVFDTCPARSQALPNRPPDTADEAIEMMRAFILRKREQDELVGRLQAWVSNHGPIVSDGMKAFYRTDARVNYPMEQMMEVLRQHGLDPHGFVNPNNKKIDGKAGKDPSLEGALAPLRKVAPHSTWAVQKASGDD